LNPAPEGRKTRPRIFRPFRGLASPDQGTPGARPVEYTHLILLNAWAKKTPLLGKGGVDAPSRNIPVPLKGADGVVRSNSKTISLERTTPSAPAKVASRHFLKWAQPPLLSQGGEFVSSPRLSRRKARGYELTLHAITLSSSATPLSSHQILPA